MGSKGERTPCNMPGTRPLPAQLAVTEINITNKQQQQQQQHTHTHETRARLLSMEAGREGELMKRGPFFSDRNSEIRTCQDKRYGRWEVWKKGGKEEGRSVNECLGRIHKCER